MYAGYEGKHTLTFVTYRVDRNSDKIENIVLESRPDGQYNPYLFSYDLTLNELDNLDKLTPETIKSRSEVVPLVAGNGGGLENINCFEAVQHFVGRWECEAGYEHEPGHPRCTIGGSRWVMHPMGLTWVYVGCGDSGGGSGGNGGSSGGGGATGGGGSGGGGNTGGGWDDGGDGDGSGGPESGPGFNLTEGQTIATQPIVFLDFNQVQLNAFFAGLTPSQQQWALANTATYSDIIDYLTNENWSEESKQFARDLIIFLTANGGSIEFNDSINSQNSVVYNSIEDFQDFIDNRDSNGFEFQTELENQDQKTVSVRFWISLFDGIKIFVKLERQPDDTFTVENTTSTMFGLTFASGWEQTEYSYSISGSIITVDVYGVAETNIFFDGIGTIYSENMHYQIRIDKNTGSIINAFYIND